MIVIELYIFFVCHRRERASTTRDATDERRPRARARRAQDSTLVSNYIPYKLYSMFLRRKMRAPGRNNAHTPYLTVHAPRETPRVSREKQESFTVRGCTAARAGGRGVCGLVWGVWACRVLCAACPVCCGVLHSLQLQR